MDPNQFDTIAKGVAGTSTRRAALGTVLASGFLTALGLKAAPLAAQDEQKQPKQPKEDQSTQPQQTCVLDFTSTVRQGPSATGNAQQIKGELTFSLTGKGTLDKASLRLASGTSVPVVGQATGPSLQLRLQFGPNQTIIAVGVGEREIADCQGAIDGIATGPAAGDLGDWHATVLRSTGATGAAGGGKNREQNAGAGGAGAAGGGQKQPKQPKHPSKAARVGREAPAGRLAADTMVAIPARPVRRALQAPPAQPAVKPDKPPGRQLCRSARSTRPNATERASIPPAMPPTAACADTPAPPAKAVSAASVN